MEHVLKPRFWLAMVLGWMILACGGPPLLVLDQEGFRDVQIGLERSEIHGLKRKKPVSREGRPSVHEEEEQQGLKYYVRPSDSLKVGNGELEAITYKFSEFNGKDVLFEVELWAKGENCGRLRAALEAKYEGLSGSGDSGEKVRLSIMELSGNCFASFTPAFQTELFKSRKAAEEKWKQGKEDRDKKTAEEAAGDL